MWRSRRRWREDVNELLTWTAVGGAAVAEEVSCSDQRV